MERHSHRHEVLQEHLHEQLLEQMPTHVVAGSCISIGAVHVKCSRTYKYSGKNAGHKSFSKGSDSCRFARRRL